MTVALLAGAVVASVGCERISEGRKRWMECERALLAVDAPAEVRAPVGAVAKTFDVACGSGHRRVCVPHALPAEVALQIQHRQRVIAARSALTGVHADSLACRDLPE